MNFFASTIIIDNIILVAHLSIMIYGYKNSLKTFNFHTKISLLLQVLVMIVFSSNFIILPKLKSGRDFHKNPKLFP